MLVFAADHGLAAESVSKYPPEVTYQMVLNFIKQGAAINVFSRLHGFDLKVIDAGVNGEFEKGLPLIDHKIAMGTRNSRYEPAMTEEQVLAALAAGATVVDSLPADNNVIALGEMGIGNTSSASLIMSLLCELPLHDCVGRGTGVDDTGLRHKIQILEEVKSFHQVNADDVLAVLAAIGGFEVVMMCGAFLRGAELGRLLLVDGFIATAAFLCAHRINSNVKDYAIFCHRSGEKGHGRLLELLEAEPVLDLNLHLGEATGAVLAYPLIQAAVAFFNQMASFDEAGVSTSDD